MECEFLIDDFDKIWLADVSDIWVRREYDNFLANISLRTFIEAEHTKNQQKEKEEQLELA
jgi:hypothetical protein